MTNPALLAVAHGSRDSRAESVLEALVARIRAERLQSRLIMQVHDELVFEVAEEELLRMELLVNEEMSRAVESRVPLKVDISHGTNWSEAH